MDLTDCIKIVNTFLVDTLETVEKCKSLPSADIEKLFESANQVRIVYKSAMTEHIRRLFPEKEDVLEDPIRAVLKTLIRNLYLSETVLTKAFDIYKARAPFVDIDARIALDQRSLLRAAFLASASALTDANDKDAVKGRLTLHSVHSRKQILAKSLTNASAFKLVVSALALDVVEPPPLVVAGRRGTGGEPISDDLSKSRAAQPITDCDDDDAATRDALDFYSNVASRWLGKRWQRDRGRLGRGLLARRRRRRQRLLRRGGRRLLHGPAPRRRARVRSGAAAQRPPAVQTICAGGRRKDAGPSPRRRHSVAAFGSGGGGGGQARVDEAIEGFRPV